MVVVSPSSRTLVAVALFSLSSFGAEPEDAKVVQRAMKAADRNKDQKLNVAEYLALDVQAAHHGDEHFAAADANHDGFLDQVELGMALRKQTWFAILQERVDVCFARLDEDKSGSLNVSEYKRMSRMGHHAEQHFNGADTNHDGSLDLLEFTAHANAKLRKLE
jgi:Ca2+-binding EF-hand superfamily protein